jgi:Tol biopolymer transport system component
VHPGAGTPGNGLIAYSDINTKTGDGDIFVMDGDGTGVTALHQPGDDYDPEWSQDGTRITFMKDREGIFVMNADGSDQQRISNVDTSALSVSPDGSRIAYEGWVPFTGTFDGQSTARDALDNTVTTSIWLMDADGSNQRPLAGTEGSSGMGATWSPDGTQLAFGMRNGVWVVGADGSDPHEVVSDGDVPVWSPDGSTILFVRAHGVMSVAPDGTGLTELAGEPHTEYRDTGFAPDGTRIFATWAPPATGPQNYEIYSMDPDGTNVQQLTNVGTDDQGWGSLSPSWQPVPGAGSGS